MKHKIFSYGTLRYESVQLSTFGRKLIGKEDTLTGYQLSEVKITDSDVIAASGEAVHPILIFTGNHSDQIAGMVFDVSEQELMSADQYEVADYKRVSAMLLSGVDAWVYVKA